MITSNHSMNSSFSASWSATELSSVTEANFAPAELSDYQLILRCQQGTTPDHPAFSELLRRHQSYVEKILYHLAPDWPDRADLVQEVWLRVYRNIQQLKDPAKFRGWLSRITTNLFYDELRKRKRVNNPISLDAPGQFEDRELTTWEIATALPSPDQKLSNQELYDQLNHAIADLPESFRITMILQDKGFSYKEITKITGVSLGTVKSRIARARARVKRALHSYL